MSSAKPSHSSDERHYSRKHARSSKAIIASLDVWMSQKECEKLNFPTFQEPKQIGFFSLDNNRSFTPDDSELKFFYVPSNFDNVNFDLNVAYEEAVKKEFLLCEKIDNILKWILHNRNILPKVKPNDSSLNYLETDFICYRGLLTEILCTIYEAKEGWIICATKYGGSIYLCGFPTESKIQRHKEMDDRGKRMTSWGYKFEQYMTTVSARGTPTDPVIPVNENPEFCCLVRSRLNKKSLLYAAEMDGLEPKFSRDYPQKTGSTNGYMELKTSRRIDNQRQERTLHKFKFIKWWAQSFLIGVPRVYCGFRDDEGIVRSVKVFPTREIPKMATMGEWSASACMNFLDQFLNYVQSCVTVDNPKIVYKFEWYPKGRIQCNRLDDAGRFEILPEWYTSKMNFKSEH